MRINLLPPTTPFLALSATALARVDSAVAEAEYICPSAEHRISFAGAESAACAFHGLP